MDKNSVETRYGSYLPFEAALCIWEHIIDTVRPLATNPSDEERRSNPFGYLLQDEVEGNGHMEMRYRSYQTAPFVLDVYDKMCEMHPDGSDGFQAGRAYDWEIVPDIVETLWDRNTDIFHFPPSYKDDIEYQTKVINLAKEVLDRYEMADFGSNVWRIINMRSKTLAIRCKENMGANCEEIMRRFFRHGLKHEEAADYIIVIYGKESEAKYAV